MPSRKELPDDLKRQKLVNALTRLGFAVSTKGGKGSHIKITWRNQKSLTVQNHLRRDVLYYLLKEIKEISGLTWEDIKKEM